VKSPGWVEEPLANVAHIERDAVAADRIQPGTRYIGLEHIDGEGRISTPQVVENGEIESTKFAFSNRHILYGKLRPYLRKIALPDFEGVCSTDILPIFPKNGKMDRRFLYHYLRQQHLIDLATTRSTGANLPRLSPRILAEFPVTYPRDTAEQGRIAAILDKADAIRRKHEQVLALADNFLRSTFLHMFGDPATNPRRFELKRIEKVLSSNRAGIQSGPFGSSLKKHEYVSQGISVWGIDNVQPNRFIPCASLFITEKKYEQLQRYAVKEGDVLISRAGTVGRMCIARPDTPTSIISTNIVRVSLNQEKLLSEYFVNLFTYFSHRLGGLKTNQKENAFTFLNPTTLKSLEIPVPPIGAQRAFADFLNNRDALVGEIGAAIAESETLFASLSQRAFRGEL